MQAKGTSVGLQGGPGGALGDKGNHWTLRLLIADLWESYFSEVCVLGQPFAEVLLILVQKVHGPLSFKVYLFI